MSRKSGRSATSLSLSQLKVASDTSERPYDTLNVKIKSLKIPDEDPQHFTIKLTYFDQLVVSSVIKSVGARDKERMMTVAEGSLIYDPSDYEKMCLFADCPLVVTIQPLRTDGSFQSQQSMSSSSNSRSKSDSTKTSNNSTNLLDVSCCNVDILPMFLGDQETSTICVKKRMEPMIKPSVLHCKSWDCLPLLTMELVASRHKDNAKYHKDLKASNCMQITIVAAYNMALLSEEKLEYTALTKTPLYCEVNAGIARFNEGAKATKKFNPTNFYAKWESLSTGRNTFATGDVKFTYNFKDIRNEDKLSLYHYMYQMPQDNTIVWTSFHRSLLIKRSSEDWFAKHIQQYKWPLELHIQDEENLYSFMAFINLFQLLYPGEKTVRAAVPLLWLHEQTMMQECNCDSLNSGDNKAVSSTGTVQKTDRAKTESTVSTEANVPILTDTGADENPAFVIVEVKLARALYKVAVPTPIPRAEINEMLKTSESMGPLKRRCFGRLVFAKKWQTSLQLATTALRRVPYFGTTEFSVFVRQLSETRTRVELSTTCWQNAALFVNNNFILQQYLHSEEIFEELVMMTHACLVRLACDHLLEVNQQQKDVDPVLRAARQAKQMRDKQHAMDLYLQVTVNNPRDGNIWRELATCLKDIDRDWARVSLYNSILLNPRHPLTLLSACGMVYEEDPAVAEQFFSALLFFYPLWIVGNSIAGAYFHHRQQFLVYDEIMKLIQKCQREGQTEEIPFTRGWERELGDWWDSTQLLPGMSPFYDAADVLLRLRCIGLAELCLARSLSQVGESAAYYHLVALCCRLRGEYQDALCHVQVGVKKYGEVMCLKSLEAECHHMLGHIPEAMASYEKCSTSRWPYTVLMMLPVYADPVHRRAVLWDLARRHPCAYTWMALAEVCTMNLVKSEYDEEMAKSEMPTCGTNASSIACAVQALKCDRLAGRAWALLAANVKPSARRHYCLKMANLCGYHVEKDRVETVSNSKQSSCYRLGTAITECRCRACERLKL